MFTNLLKSWFTYFVGSNYDSILPQYKKERHSDGKWKKLEARWHYYPLTLLKQAWKYMHAHYCMQVSSHLHAVIFMSSAKMGYYSLHAGTDVQNWSFHTNTQPNYAKLHVIFLVISSWMQDLISYFCRGHQNACLRSDAFFILFLGHIVLWGRSNRSWYMVHIVLGAWTLWRSLFLGLL